MKRFRGVLVCNAHSFLYHSTLGSRVIKTKKRSCAEMHGPVCEGRRVARSVRRRPNRPHPGGNPAANLESIFHRSYLREVASEWQLTEETIYVRLAYLQGGFRSRDTCWSPALQRIHHLPLDTYILETQCGQIYCHGGVVTDTPHRMAGTL